MNRRKKYRLFILCFLALDLAVMAFLGYRYLDRKIPDEIHVSKESNSDVSKLLDHPLISFKEAITVSGDGGYILPCKYLGFLPFKEVRVIPVNDKEVYVSGNVIGIYMETQGVMIIDTGEIRSGSGQIEEPAKNIVRPGDYIVAFNEDKISTKKELMDELKDLDGGQVTLEINRAGESIPVSVTPVRDMKGEYKLGIWVRDDTQGIGTLTYVDENDNFGALGHGISDIDTGQLLNIRDGALYKAQILSVNKGSKGNPGELSGMIRYDERNVLGTITDNDKNGIYGHLYNTKGEWMNLRKMPVAHKQEVQTGPAAILCCIDGTVREYSAQIKRIDLNHEDSNKSFVIQITDDNLLETTGGVVQGMSGSPVIQNGKLAGAVTHVFVQDSSTGYGIFAETMLGQ